VGILIGTFASDFSSTFARIRLSAATHDIASGLRQTRNLALANGHPERFELDMTQHAYRISPQKPWISLPSAIELSLFTTTEDILDNGRGSIRFFQDGSSSGGRITLVDLPIIFHVDVNWLTSEVTIRRGE
jgi:general secretion pathway protein H